MSKVIDFNDKLKCRKIIILNGTKYQAFNPVIDHIVEIEIDNAYLKSEMIKLKKQKTYYKNKYQKLKNENRTP